MVKRSPASIKPEGTLVQRLDLILSHLNAVHINLILLLFCLFVGPKAVFPLKNLLINILHVFFSLHITVPCATNPILLLELLTSFLHVWRVVILNKQLLAHRASWWKTKCLANLQSTNIILHQTDWLGNALRTESYVTWLITCPWSWFFSNSHLSPSQSLKCMFFISHQNSECTQCTPCPVHIPRPQ